MSEPHTILNTISLEEAGAALARCCGAPRWVAAMLGRRPWSSVTALYEDADAVWAGLERFDYLEAFAHHPRIGGSGDGQGSGAESSWSRQEQARVGEADVETRRKLAAANERYFARFGYIFIVCATGKSADEMLRLIEARLDNDPGHELAIAAGEQARIMRLRIGKLGEQAGA